MFSKEEISIIVKNSGFYDTLFNIRVYEQMGEYEDCKALLKSLSKMPIPEDFIIEEQEEYYQDILKKCNQIK